jgi:hypothetical protein
LSENCDLSIKAIKEGGFGGDYTKPEKDITNNSNST